MALPPHSQFYRHFLPPTTNIPRTGSSICPPPRRLWRKFPTNGRPAAVGQLQVAAPYNRHSPPHRLSLPPTGRHRYSKRLSSSSQETPNHGRCRFVEKDASAERLRRTNGTRRGARRTRWPICRAGASARGFAATIAHLEGHRAALFASSRRAGSRTGEARFGRGHGHGQRQDALLQPADPRSGIRRPAGPGTLSISDQGARTGSTQGPAGPRR